MHSTSGVTLISYIGRHELILNYTLTQRAGAARYSRLIRSMVVRAGQVQHHRLRAPSHWHCRSASACCYEDRAVQDDLDQGEH